MIKLSLHYGFFIVLGVSALVGNSLVLYITFLRAYFNNYRILVTCNSFNEAHFEFFFIPFSIFVGFVVLYNFMFKMTIKIKRRNNKGR